jgi:hypothetical protein
MKKTIATALIAALLASNAAVAQEIRPLDTTASTSADSLPILTVIPPGAIVLLGFVILAGVVVGIAADGT